VTVKGYESSDLDSLDERETSPDVDLRDLEAEREAYRATVRQDMVSHWERLSPEEQVFVLPVTPKNNKWCWCGVLALVPHEHVGYRPHDPKNPDDRHNLGR
jgi:hypothetical protein